MLYLTWWNGNLIPIPWRLPFVLEKKYKYIILSCMNIIIHATNVMILKCSTERRYEHISKSSSATNLDQNLGSKQYERPKRRGCSDIVYLWERVSAFFVQCNDTSDVPPSRGVGPMWSCAHHMDVPYGKVHENIEEFRMK